MRLRELTRFLCGDDRPKQFCPLLGEQTLVQETRHRAERSINPDQIRYSFTQAHEDYYSRDLHGCVSQRIIQPSNRGTAPAILYALLHILQMDRDAIVAILPCDHYYSSEQAFTAALEAAFALAEARPASVVLLGAQPKTPEVEYGWIEVGETVSGTHRNVFQVRSFLEKPSLSVAQRLLRERSLWNTFIMLGRVSAFLDLAAESVPNLVEVLRSACAPHRARTFLNRETRIAEALYDRIAATCFSRQILSPGATRLISTTLEDVEWNDLGDPERVIATLFDRDGGVPSWVARWRVHSRRTGALPRKFLSTASM